MTLLVQRGIFRLRAASLVVRRPISQRWQQTAAPADSPGFQSIVDKPAQIVRIKRKRGFGLALLAAMPIISFALGTWQIKRLDWKTRLIAVSEDRIILEPLPLPMRIDPAMVPEFDYRRVTAEGIWRHDQEMLLGPRIRDGKNGYLVITPLERDGGKGTVLVNRGWIAKTMADQAVRRKTGGLPEGIVQVEGLLREPIPRNWFSVENKPETNEFHFPDVYEMAELTGSQPVWIEATEKQDLLRFYEKEEEGLPIARAAEVNLRNNHVQYIFTWYSLSFATSIMLWMVMRKPPSNITRRVARAKG